MAVLAGPADAGPAPRRATLAGLVASRAGRIAWVLIGLSLPLLATGIWLQLVPVPDPVPIAYGAGALAAASVGLLSVVTPVSGAVIVAARPVHRLGWLLVATAPIGGLFALAFGIVRVQALGEASPAVAALVDATFQPVLFTVAALAMLWFPDGRLPGRRWWPVYVVLVGGALLRGLEGALSPAGSMFPGYRTGLEGSGPVDGIVGWSLSLGGVGFRLQQTAFLLAAASLVVRHLRAGGDEQRQLRWVIAAGLVAFAGTVPLGLVTVVSGTDADAEWAVVLFNLGFSLMGPAILIAISRYRLYEIDHIVNRAVLYGVLTAVVAGVAAGSTTLIQRGFMALTGDRSDVAVVIAAVLAATVYTPLRRRVEAWVDRRFRWETPRFGAYRAALEDQLALATLDGAARRLARETVRGLGATGAEVLASDGRSLARTGPPGDVVAARIDVDAPAGTIGAVLVGARTDGRPHDAAALRELEELAVLAARVLTAPAVRAPTPGTRRRRAPRAPGDA